MMPFETVFKTKRNSWKLYGGWNARMEILYPLSGKDGGTCIADHYIGGADFAGYVIMPPEMVPEKYKANAKKIIEAMRHWTPDQCDGEYVEFICFGCDERFNGAPSRSLCRVCDTKANH